jgi:hypothetical protein
MRHDFDAAVDAVICGDATPEQSALVASDPARAAGLMTVHALLLARAEGDAASTAAVTDEALRGIEERQTRTYTFPSMRRLASMAAVAFLAIGGFTVWYTLSAEHRAVATLLEGHSQPGTRRYDLAVYREGPTPPLTLAGATYVDGHGTFVLKLPLPNGAAVTFGRTGEQWWIVTPEDEVRRGSDDEVVEAWIRSIDPGAPFPSIDRTLEQFEQDYDVVVSVEPDGTITYRGERTSEDPSLAKLVVFRFSRSLKKIREVSWTWDPPAGAIAKVVEVRADLAERVPVPPDWFAPEAHRAGAPSAPAAREDAAPGAAAPGSGR